MKKLLALLVVLLIPVAQAASSEVDARQLLDESRKVAARLVGDIGGELVRELKVTGPVRAIIVCKYTAPEAATAISRETGMRVTRVSLRPRNRTIGEPDAWEQQVLLDFEKRMAVGEKPEAIEHSEIVVEPKGRSFRYLKAIPMGQVCLTCHGPSANIPEAVRAKLNVEYPHDRGVDFRAGQVLGAVSVKKPL